MTARTSGLTLITVMALGTAFYSQTVGPITGSAGSVASSVFKDTNSQETHQVSQAGAIGKTSNAHSTGRRDRRGSSVKTRPGGQPVTQNPAAPDLCYRDAYRLVQEFFQTDPASGTPASPPDLMKVAEEYGYTVEFLIASFPDPVDSKVGWRYDLFLDAVQRALEADSFVQDRFSLPWKCASDDTTATPTKHSRLQEREPGVILFRHLKRHHLLVLFLVGERPTSGISKGAFLRAVDCMRACKNWDRQVRIMGPATSGAVLSLRLALQDCYARAKREDKGQDPLRFTIISGSATSDSNKETLEQSIDGEGRSGMVRFYATVNPDGAALAAFKEYLEYTDPGANVAVLRESNTAYGQEATKPQKKGNEEENSADEHDDHWLVIPFPMQISQLRSDYEKEKRLEQQAASTANVTTNKPRTNLSLPLEELGEAQDSPPAFTPLMTSAEADLVVTNILSSISRMNVKYVGLLGTDTRDKLFFAQQIRKYCPDVRLFTFETDILYAHPDYNSYLAGMIVVSTYPFFDRSQAWALWPKQAKADNSLLYFPMEGAKGAYNATLALLNYDRDGKKVGTGGIRPALIDYGGLVHRSTSSGVGKPPVWLTLVGRNAFWPLRVFADVPQSEGYLFPAAEPGAVAPQGQVSANAPVRFRAGALLWVAFLVVSLVSAASCVGRAKYGSGSERKSVAPIFRSPFRHQREHSIWLFFYFLALTCLYGGLASFAVIEPIADLAFRRRHGVLDLGGIALISALFTALAMATLTTLAETLPLAGSRKLVAKRRLPAALDQHWIRQALPFVFSLACGGVAAHYLPHTVRQAGDGAIGPVIFCYGPVFYARAISLASGVSPVMPAIPIAAGFCFWSLINLARIRLQADTRSSFPLKGGKEFLPDFTALVKAVEELLQHPLKGLRNEPVTAVVMLFLVPIVAVVWVAPLPTYERAPFGLLFGAVLVTLYLAIVFESVKSLCLWVRLKRLLQGLGSHPVIASFVRLPAGPKPVVQFWPRLPGPDHLAARMQILILLAKRYPGLDNKLFQQGSGLVSGCYSVQSLALSPRPAAEVAQGEQAPMVRCLKPPQELAEQLEVLWKDRAVCQNGNGAYSKDRSGLEQQAKREPAGGVNQALPLDVQSPADMALSWVEPVEDLVALHIALFIRKALTHVRNLLTFITVGAFLILLAITSYPFEPRSVMTISMYGVILSFVAFSVISLIQGERDEVLSRIAKTNPHEISLDGRFVPALLTFGVLPLLGLLFTQVPALQKVFFWIEPILRALK